MKIISKFKDFYDFATSGYIDDDNSIIFNRISKYFLSNFLENPINLSNNNNIVKLYEKLQTFKKSKIYIMKDNKDSLRGVIEFQIIGVYPEIRILPMVSIYNIPQEKNIKFTGYNKIKCNPHINKLIESFKEDNLIFNREKLEIIAELYSLRFIYNNKYYLGISEKLNDINIINRNYLDYKKLTEKDLIIENPDLFYAINSPIFYMSDHNRIIDNNYDFNIVTDCNFSELTNINLDWLFSNPITIRNRIESFLIEYKRRNTKYSEPDNKIKIESHGFDIKTSFRKM